MTQHAFVVVAAEAGTGLNGANRLEFREVGGGSDARGTNLDAVRLNAFLPGLDDGENDLNGDAGNDTLIGDAGVDSLSGGTGLDVLIGGGGDDDLSGNDDDDTLHGGAGNDTLRGGTGNDALTGGGGSDTLTGGAGADRFVFGKGFGQDRVTDFQAGAVGEDVLAFARTVFADAASVLARTDDLGAGGFARIVFDAQNSVTLTGVHKADLIASDFLFF
jgi:Ca2+-binding RTX toxin-like protein